MLKSGDSFGDYRVLRLLDQGGMGSVFLLENAAGGTPELNYADRRKYVDGRFFAMLEDLHKRCPDLFVRYREASRNWKAPALAYDRVLEDLCAVYGNDWPRRWPAEECVTPVEKSEKKPGEN